MSEWRRWITADALKAQWRWHESGRQGPGRLVLEGKDLRGLERIAHLRGVRLVRCDLTGARLPALLEDIELVGCVLDRADLGGAALDRARIDDCRFAGAHLDLAKFRDAQVRLGSFAGSRMENGSWRGASVTGVDFAEAQMPGIELDEAVFRDCDFQRARIVRNRPVFEDKGTAYGTRFEGCDFRGADVDGLRMRGTVFDGCRLAGT
ncbi:MAG TPA: pentapeptide repeat-containing protein, partial [Kofleriaceae bacterium]|nr:pentapeptide repeat-containing protein [Kofleriaceae bacterium]